jgi:hypothetical protein
LYHAAEVSEGLLSEDLHGAMDRRRKAVWKTECACWPLARSGRKMMSAIRSLSGDKRTLRGSAKIDANDPNRKSAPLFDHLLHAHQKRQRKLDAERPCAPDLARQLIRLPAPILPPSRRARALLGWYWRRAAPASPRHPRRAIEPRRAPATLHRLVR